jgi:hypothetical protein
MCRDFLFNVVVGSSGWTVRQDRSSSTTLTNLTRPSVEGGRWLFTIVTLGQRQGGSGGIGDIVEAALLRRKEPMRTGREDTTWRLPSRLWRMGGEREDL